MKSRLTDIAIKKLSSPQSGQVTYWDELTPGFGLRCSAKSKSFVVMFGEKRRLKTLGRYPSLTLSDARKEAKRFLAQYQESPVVFEETAISFQVAKKKFLDDCEGRNKPRTVSDYARLLNRHFNFKANVNDISRQQVMNIISNIAQTPSEQAHAFVAIRIMMNWCVRHGYLDQSPVPTMKQRTQSRNRILSEDELGIVYARSLEHPYPFGPIVQLAILTGQRRSEIAALRRSWIEGSAIIFPEGFTKNKREHRLPISPTAKKILAGIPETGDLFFPARGNIERSFNGWGKCKAKFDGPLNVDSYTLHDLRRTFSSNMAMLGTPIHVTEKLLNHVSGTISGVAAVYNRHSYMEEMRHAVQQYDTYLENLIHS